MNLDYSEVWGCIVWFWALGSSSGSGFDQKAPDQPIIRQTYAFGTSFFSGYTSTFPRSLIWNQKSAFSSFRIYVGSEIVVTIFDLLFVSYLYAYSNRIVLLTWLANPNQNFSLQSDVRVTLRNLKGVAWHQT